MKGAQRGDFIWEVIDVELNSVPSVNNFSLECFTQREAERVADDLNRGGVANWHIAPK